MRIALAYGKGQMEVEVAEANLKAVAAAPKPILPSQDETAEIERALALPIGSPRLREMASGKRNAAIIVSDHTRPTPSGKLVPSLLRELEEGGITAANVSVVFATGTHRATTEEEMRSILGEDSYSRVRALSHHCDDPDLVYVGTTNVNRTPVWMNRVVVEADLRISVSSIEPHHGAGWAGGAKNMLPGVSGRKTVLTHHAMLTRPDVQIGVLEGNPFREDLEEAASLVGLDFVVCAILAENKMISHLFAGHWIAAHRAGVLAAEKHLSFHLDAPADIVVASVGGSPRDSNLWQAEGKGLARIPSAVRDGGVIIMMAECPEGVGHPDLVNGLLIGSVDEVTERLSRSEFSIGGNKAFRIADQLKRADIYLVTSGLTAADFGELPVRLYSNAQAALAAAFDKMGPLASVVVVPQTPRVLLRVR